MAKIQAVELEDEYYHVRFNDPDRFEEIRTPDWAANAASSVSEGSEIRMGKQENSDDWEIQSILVEKEAGNEDKARDQAREIAEKINS